MAECVEMFHLNKENSKKRLLDLESCEIAGSDAPHEEKNITRVDEPKDPKEEQRRCFEKDEERRHFDDVTALEIKMDEALKNGDLRDIKKCITLKNLANCSTNCIEKSFEISHKLKALVGAKGPYADKVITLQTSVEDFAVQLLEPLKRDEKKRVVFEGQHFDRVLDEAVKYQQKKFLSHPVVYNVLITKRWKNSSCQNWFIWFFLNIWTLFDVFLFPLVHVFLGMIHLFIESAKKRQELRIAFLYKVSSQYRYKHLCDVEKYIIKQIASDRTYSATIVSSPDGLQINEFTRSDRSDLTEMHMNAESKDGKKNANNGILHCLKIARSTLFGNSEKKCKKMLVVLTDDKIGIPRNELLKEARFLKKQKVHVISVGLRKYSDINELRTISRSEEDVFLISHHDEIGEFEIIGKEKTSILECIKGKDIYDRYIQYFTTPYFIFFRDTLSYLALLGLHFAMCLQPSTIGFTPVEWIILVFFVGRLMMETSQLIREKILEERNAEASLERFEEQRLTESTSAGYEEEESEELMNWRRILSSYFDDWWNILDICILIVYVILVGLRFFIWSQHISVSKNRLLVIAGYLYGLNAMFLTLRVFGHILESNQSTGSIQIALFHIIANVFTIFGQFFAAIMAFSLAITKVYIAELSYYSGTNSTSTGNCENQTSFNCWWNFSAHLVWSIFGITDLESLDSSDKASDNVARLLYGLFLIMSVVMLMNMMIALLSNTYQLVEDNAFYEWSYKKATTIRTYMTYHPVPVPFNIISLSYILLRHIYRTVNCTKCKKSKPRETDDEHENARKKKTEFEELVKELKAKYFAKNGYVFPMSDKTRMKLVFDETKGNRKINERIAHRVFCYNQQEMKRLHSHRDPGWNAEKHITTSGQQLGLSFCDCLGDCRHGARYRIPLSEAFPKFEVLIAETGERGRMVTIGIVPENYNLQHFPGCFGNSAGYHIDDGKIFDQTNPIFGQDAKDGMAFRGDIIGCEILYEKKQPDKLPVSFTLNGRVVGVAEVDPSTGHGFYPYVGIGCKGTSLVFRINPQVTFSGEDPVFQMFKIISERLQITSDRLTELEWEMGYPSSPELQGEAESNNGING